MRPLIANGPLSVGRRRSNIVVPWALDFVTEFYDGSQGVTAAGGFASAWAPVKGTHAVSQGTGAAQPGYVNGILTFDGTDDILQSDAFTWNQPAQLFVCMSITAYYSGTDRIYLGGLATDCTLYSPSAGNLALYAGSPAATAAGPAADTFAIFKVTWNGASSGWSYNLNAGTTGNAGANNPGGLAFGDCPIAGGISGPSRMKGAARIDGVLNAAQSDQLIRAMGAYYGVSL